MTKRSPFLPGVRYLAEGGQETELMYGHGFALPHFAMFPLLDDASAVGRLTRMYQAVGDACVGRLRQFQPSALRR